MISINFYEQSDDMFVTEFSPQEKISKEEVNVGYNLSVQLQLVTVELTNKNRPPVYIPTEAFFSVI
jgi:hypothetical protein